MTRVVSLFLPSWSTDRLRRKAGDAAPPAEAPLVLIGREGNRRVVLAANAAAVAAGLRPGMPVTKAQVLVPDLIVQDAEPAADVEALDRLATWLLRYAPVVAPDPPDGIIIDSVNRRPKRTPYRRAKGTPFVEQRDGYDGRTVRAGCGVGRA